MSATLRYDIGVHAQKEIENAAPGLLANLGAAQASRWPGVRRARLGHRKAAFTFAVKLPQQVGLGYRLLKVAKALRQSTRNSMTSRSCRVLQEKLTESLGLTILWTEDQEDGFLKAIDSEPGALVNWHAYADWLEECSTREGDARRSRIIRTWLDPKKAAKVKYGVIQLEKP